MSASVAALDLNKPVQAGAQPVNLDAEQALLGCLLYDNSAVERCDGLEAHYFHEPFHQRLFAATVTLIQKGRLAEPILLADEFKRDPAFEELGGLRYLADLVDRAPPAINVPDYARTIAQHYLRREIIRIARDAEALAHTAEDAKAIIEATESELFALAENGQREGGYRPFSEAIDQAMEMATAAFQRDGELSGLSSGLIDLDQKLGGLHPSDLIILAGRPSMGKTALATNIAFHLAKQGVPVAFVSLEMSAEQLALRIAADVSGISGDRIRRGDINPDEYRRLHDTAAEIRTIPLHIDATGGLPIAKMCIRTRRLKRKHGIQFVVTDYLQLATGGEQSRRGGRVQEVSEITQSLKALAKELSVPVLALSQLSRQVENRDDKRPQLSDLRESGSIEQDADVVMFVYREAYYLERAEPREGTPEHLAWQDRMAEMRNLAEVIIGKQRHGPIGAVKLHFNADLTKFTDLAREGRYGDVRSRQPYREDQ